MIVSKNKLKESFLEFLHEVEITGKPLIVTDDGKEVLEIRSLTPPELTVEQALDRYREVGMFCQNCSDEELMSSGEDWNALMESAGTLSQ